MFRSKMNDLHTQNKIYCCFCRVGRVDTNFWRYSRSFYQTIHLQASFLNLTYTPYLYDLLTNWEREIFTNVRVQVHEVNILNGLIFACFIVKTNGFCSTHVYSNAVMQRTLFYYGMREQFSCMVHNSFIVKFTFILNLDLISRLRYLL